MAAFSHLTARVGCRAARCAGGKKTPAPPRASPSKDCRYLWKRAGRARASIKLWSLSMERESLLTRRGLLLLTGAGLAGLRLHAASADFWNKKPPSQWTSQEVDLLITKSPW